MAFNGNDNTQSSDSDFLDLPSPYHAAPSPQPQTSIQCPDVNLLCYLPSFLNRSTYHPILDAQYTNKSHESPTSPRSSPRTPRVHHVHWGDMAPPQRARRTNWTLFASLALLLSLTLNAFFLAYLGGERRYATIPHETFAVSELGHNYTCYRERTTQLYRVDRFERAEAAYDDY